MKLFFIIFLLISASFLFSEDISEEDIILQISQELNIPLIECKSGIKKIQRLNPDFVIDQKNKKRIKKELIEQHKILEISKDLKIPLKKCYELIKAEKKKNPSFVLNKKGIKVIEDNFTKIFNPFGWKIVIVGMSVVFGSLILISFIISKLQFFINPRKSFKKQSSKVSVETSIGKISANEGDLSTNSIVAVITAIYAHAQEVEQKNKINMDWKRAPVSMWKSVSKASFPNNDYKILTRR